MSVRVRRAMRSDLPAIVGLLADDVLGRAREVAASPLPPEYGRAFEAIAADANHLLVVAEAEDEIAGTLHFTVLPSLTYRGRARAQIEAVRVRADLRGAGVGAALVRWAMDEAGRRGCHVVQLTSDKRRPEALAFYERLGFQPTHEGLKRWLHSES